MYKHTLFFLISSIVLVSAQNQTRFAVIGDYGSEGSDLKAVSDLIDSWNTDFIITTGDNNYPDGKSRTIDDNIGQYFHNYIAPYTGSYGSGADSNRFFPCLGNHDWRADGAQPYLDYFNLPGNERYYDFRRGSVHFFSIDSDSHEPDGNDSSSVQAMWLKHTLAVSDAPWKVVYFHHPPYSSGKHGSNAHMRWPFKAWGADLIITGHDHIYERLFVDSLTYIVNGLGGRSLYSFGSIVNGSQMRYNGDYGAMRVEATKDSLVMAFYNTKGERIDYYSLTRNLTAINSDTRTKSNRLTSCVLAANYPNPFNPQTTIPYRALTSTHVELSIFNVHGQKIVTLTNGYRPPGNYSVVWDGKNSLGQQVPSGIYWYRLQTDYDSRIRAMLLLK